jgi:succinoglycan biosynthesis transport protein ExoP
MAPAPRRVDQFWTGAAGPVFRRRLQQDSISSGRAMKDVLQTAKTVYDVVFIDTPALAAVSDAFPLLNQVDGIIIVGRIAHNRPDVAEQLQKALRSVGAPLLGVVANGVKSRGPGAYT